MNYRKIFATEINTFEFLNELNKDYFNKIIYDVKKSHSKLEFIFYELEKIILNENDFMVFEIAFAIFKTFNVSSEFNLVFSFLEKKLVSEILENPNSIANIKVSFIESVNLVYSKFTKFTKSGLISLIINANLAELLNLLKDFNQKKLQYQITRASISEPIFNSCSAFIPVLEKVNLEKVNLEKRRNSSKSRISQEFQDSMQKLKNRKLKQDIKFLKEKNKLLEKNRTDLLKQISDDFINLEKIQKENEKLKFEFERLQRKQDLENEELKTENEKRKSETEESKSNSSSDWESNGLVDF